MPDTVPSATRSVLRSRRSYRLGVLFALALLCVAAFFLSVYLGTLTLTPGDVLAVLWGDGDTAGIRHQIIWNIRLPRTLVAALVGMCLSLSGCLLQGVMRNPLAAPHLIGVSAGAGLAGVIILIIFPATTYLLTPVTFIGALVTTVLIYLLAWQQGLKPVRLILAGVAVSSFLGAWITALMLFFPDRVHSVLGFMVGGLAARTWQHLFIILPYAVGGFILVLGCAGRLNLLMLGDEMAQSLGIHVERTRLVLIALAALLAASAVSVAGLLGFVGLMVPHMTRMIIGSDHRYLIPGCALTGAALLMACDTLARVALDPVEVPVGVIMALLGAPFFLYLLRTDFQRR
ncbi:MAG: iron ABC transporter permease [Pseudomonadota bacterium]